MDKYEVCRGCFRLLRECLLEWISKQQTLFIILVVSLLLYVTVHNISVLNVTVFLDLCILNYNFFSNKFFVVSKVILLKLSQLPKLIHNLWICLSVHHKYTCTCMLFIIPAGREPSRNKEHVDLHLQGCICTSIQVGEIRAERSIKNDVFVYC